MNDDDAAWKFHARQTIGDLMAALASLDRRQVLEHLMDACVSLEHAIDALPADEGVKPLPDGRMLNP